jgi:hypothetical protein
MRRASVLSRKLNEILALACAQGNRSKANSNVQNKSAESLRDNSRVTLMTRGKMKHTNLEVWIWVPRTSNQASTRIERQCHEDRGCGREGLEALCASAKANYIPSP